MVLGQDGALPSLTSVVGYFVNNPCLPHTVTSGEPRRAPRSILRRMVPSTQWMAVQYNLRLTWESMALPHQLEARKDIHWKGQLWSLLGRKQWPPLEDCLTHSVEPAGGWGDPPSCKQWGQRVKDACHHLPTFGCSRPEMMLQSECWRKRSEVQVQGLSASGNWSPYRTRFRLGSLPRWHCWSWLVPGTGGGLRSKIWGSRGG